MHRVCAYASAIDRQRLIVQSVHGQLKYTQALMTVSTDSLNSQKADGKETTSQH